MRISLSSISFLVFVTVVGCASQAPTESDNAERAKFILETSLDAWKAGHPETLATRKPAIRFVDDDQRAGKQLLDYNVEDDVEQNKPHQNVAIVLTVHDKQGRTSEVRATYQIGVEPLFTMLRSDN